MAVALLFLLLTAVGLWTVDDYTGSYDEIAEQAILASNMKEYALGLEKLGIRCHYWLSSQAVEISQSVERDHGISGYYLYGLLFPLLENSETLRYMIWSMMTWMWFMFGVWSLYALAREIGMNRPISCLATMMLYLSPRFFADGHFNNKDVVLLCLMLATLWLGVRFLKRMSVGRGMLFSFVGALATNTKIVAAMAWGLMIGGAAVMLIAQKEWKKNRIVVLGMTITGFAGFYLLLTPAMWSNPIGFFTYLFTNATAFSRWSGTLFFRGASFKIPENPLPLYYLGYMMLVTLPVHTFPLCAVGQISVLRRFIKAPRAFLASPNGIVLGASTLCWVISMAAFVVFRPLVYNGWRHFYFTFAGLAVLGGVGIGTLWKLCSCQNWLKRVWAAALAFCFVSTAIGMIINHPRQSSYYNMLSGSSVMETDYWNTSGTYALDRLIACEERNKDLPLEVGCYFFDIQNARFKFNDEQKAVLTTTVQKDSPYLYFIENYVQVYGIPKPEGYHVLFKVEGYGRVLGTMYERDT